MDSLWLSELNSKFSFNIIGPMPIESDLIFFDIDFI